MEDGYYWVTHVEFGERQVVEVLDNVVYVMGDDRVHLLEEFTNYVRVIREIPNPENITIEELE